LAPPTILIYLHPTRVKPILNAESNHVPHPSFLDPIIKLELNSLVHHKPI